MKSFNTIYFFPCKSDFNHEQEWTIQPTLNVYIDYNL